MTTTAESIETTTPTTDTPPRFTLFQGEDFGWVLRDHLADRDYLFLTRPAAIGGMERRVTEALDFLGSPIHINAYGQPMENSETFA